jgi:branched-chain amino acid transport system ATP-binding protein
LHNKKKNQHWYDKKERNVYMLELNQVNSFYDKSHILFNVSLNVQDNEIVSVLGRNGMGKSTLLKTIIGEVTPHGLINFKNRKISGLKPYEIARLGVGYVPEDRCIFSDLTVYQNLLMGLKRGKKESRIKIDEIFKIFPILKERSNVPGGSLSGGEQQMLTICRTLMGDPDLIMVDEPTEGLSPKMIETVREILLLIAQKGISILLVEQKLALVLEISKRIYVISHGRLVFEGTCEDFKSNPNIRKEYLEV